MKSRSKNTSKNKKKSLTLWQALEIELDRGGFVIAAREMAECAMCHRTDELRCNVCYYCMDLVRTDMNEVWELADPKHRWPYQYHTQPIEGISDDDATELIQRAMRSRGLHYDPPMKRGKPN